MMDGMVGKAAIREEEVPGFPEKGHRALLDPPRVIRVIISL